jgi:DNA-binding beta-propeller fold protein YncE
LTQTLAILAVTLGTVGPCLANEGKIYFTSCFEGCSLRKANLDGSNDQIALNEDIGVDFDLDLTAGKVYYSGGFFSNPGTMRRAGMNGSNAETLLSDVGVVIGVAVDPLGRKFYFGDQDYDGGTTTGEVRRANLDGSNPETILSVVSGDIDVDPFAEKLYFVTALGIQRSDLDGSNVETVVGPGDVTPLSPSGIAVDPAKGKLYWADSGDAAPRILRVNVDGSNVETLVTDSDVSGPFRPLRIALDLGTGQMYWTDDHAIRRANTDGTNIQVVMEWDPGALGGPVDIEIATPGNVVPATSMWAAVLLVLTLIGAATVIMLRRRSRSTSR